MEGRIIDFQVHVHAILELQKFRLDWKFMSSQSRQINTMSGFLSLLAHTTSHQSDLTHIESRQRSLPLSPSLPLKQHTLCFEFTYGITDDVARAIEETFKLYQSLNHYVSAQKEIPEDLLEACEGLGCHLNSWTFDHDRAVTLFPGDQNMQMIFNHHANAWHRATFIYYLQCIQGYPTQNVTEHVEQLLAHMNSAEQIKSKLPGIFMAPITWPAFIASCSATERAPWELWWTQAQHYAIGSIKRQFEIVKIIWAEMDSDPGISWLNVIRKCKIEVLAL
jgi:arginine metabolism regulation protein II